MFEGLEGKTMGIVYNRHQARVTRSLEQNVSYIYIQIYIFELNINAYIK